MTKPINKSKMQQQEIRYRDRIIIALTTIIILLSVAYFRIPKQIEIHNIPSLENKITTKIGYMPPSTVYSFAILLWETINYCEEDCEKEYITNLNNSRPFLTEQCYTELANHAQENRQLFKGRSRQLTMLDNTIFSSEKVNQIDQNTWIVTESFGYDETINGNRLSGREFNMQYPLRIVKRNVSEHLNPYRLQLDCFAGNPQRIEIETKNR